MKTKALFILLVGSLLGLAAWAVHVPSNAQPGSEGGIPKKYRETIAKGLEYLAKNQHKDGHWEGDDGKHPVAMTALVGMALLMEGSTIEKGKYSANIRKAADWLLAKSDPKRDGLIFSDHPSEIDRYMYGHGLATQFLAWANVSEADKERRETLSKILTQAKKYILKAQSIRGGWYRTSKVEGHDFDEVLATAIQMQALTMTGEASVEVTLDGNDACNHGQGYLKLALEKYEKGAKPGPNSNRATETAAALACGWDCHAGFGAQTKKWFKYCETEMPVGQKIRLGRDELTHYYYALAVLSESVAGVSEGAPSWASFSTALFDQLQTGQNKDGSWPAGDGLGVGPVYSTAVWCTVMQLDSRRHPLIRQPPQKIF